jgi:hypothetical protein
MALREGDDYTVSDEISEAVKTALDLCLVRILAVLLIILIDILENIAVKFLLGADKGFYPTLEREREKRVFTRHILVEFFYPVSLGS